MTTTATPEQFAYAYKTSMDTFFSLAQTAFEGVEKLVELNLNAVKANMQESAGKAKQLMTLKDPQDVLAYHTAQVQPAAEKAVAYSRHVYDITTATQAEFTKVTEGKIAEANQSLVSFIDSAAKNAPAGSETAVAMVKSAVAAANSAYDTVSKAAKQAVEMAEANVAAATHAAVKTAGQTASATRSKK